MAEYKKEGDEILVEESTVTKTESYSVSDLKAKLANANDRLAGVQTEINKLTALLAKADELGVVEPKPAVMPPSFPE